MTYSAQHTEIDRIYALVSSCGYRSIAITACNEGEGVSTVASSLAQRLLLSGHSTLLVDLNFYRPSLMPVLEARPSDKAQEALFDSPQLVAPAANEVMAVTGIAAPSGKNVLVKLRRPGVLEQCLEHWMDEFEVVIFDTSPLNRVNSNNLPAERVAGACDATLLVALARYTTQAQVSQGIQRLAAGNANLAGSIINDRDNPSLKSELLRQLRRFCQPRGWIARRLENLILRNRLLSLDV